MTRLNVRDFGTALSFDGVNDYVGGGVPFHLVQGTPHTVAMWINARTPSTDGRLFANRYSNTEQFTFGIRGSSQLIEGAFYTGSSYAGGRKTAIKITKGMWYLACWVYDGTSSKIYLNAVDSDGGSSNIGGALGNLSWTIGQRNDRLGASSTPFNGIIDEPMVWEGRALSASEVSELYYNGLTRGSALATGLVGEWLFNEGSGSTAYDTSGSGNHGTITGATYTTDVPMVARGDAGNRVATRDNLAALSFDGVDDYIGVPDAGLPASTFQGGFTLSAWIKPASIGENSSGHIFSKNTSTTGTDGFYLSMQTQDRINFRVNGNTSRNSGVNAAPKGVWTHVCASVLGDGTVNMYSNGVLTGTANQVTGALAGITTTNDLAIGNNPTSFSRTFDGKIDEPRIWNRALSASEISDLYYNGLTRGSALATGLIGEWTFDGHTNDTSGNNNHGTLTGATFTQDTPTKKRNLINGNLIRNGDFKYTPPFTAATTTSARYIDGTASGSTTNGTFAWWLWVLAGSASAQYDTSTLYNGNPSIKVSTTTTSGRAQVRSIGSNTTPPSASSKYSMVQLLPNTQYTFSGAYKTNGVASNSVYGYVREVDGTLATAADQATTKLTGTNDWTRFSITFTTGATTRYGFIALLNDVAGNVSDAWFADIQLKPTTPQTRQTA